MPLVGTICCQDGQQKPFSECLQRCGEGACKHPLPMLVNMAKNGSKRKGIGVSTSVLGGCPRAYILGRDTDYYESPEDYYARWFGSFGHYAIEMDGPYEGIIQEVRFYRDIDGIQISGQPDWIDTINGVIADHKMVSRRPRGPRQEHIAQLNVYKWLVDASVNPFVDTKKLEVRYYHPGDSRHSEFEVPIWSEEDVETYVRSRLRPILRYDATKSLRGVGCFGEGQEWRAAYCPFRHGVNGGNCCMVHDERID